jgi:hypothetical protein
MRETRRSRTTGNDSYSTSLRLPLPRALDWGTASLKTHRSRRRTRLHCSPLNSGKQGFTVGTQQVGEDARLSRWAKVLQQLAF